MLAVRSPRVALPQTRTTRDLRHAVRPQALLLLPADPSTNQPRRAEELLRSALASYQSFLEHEARADARRRAAEGAAAAAAPAAAQHAAAAAQQQQQPFGQPFGQQQHPQYRPY